MISIDLSMRWLFNFGVQTREAREVHPQQAAQEGVGRAQCKAAAQPNTPHKPTQ
jgi:hypothetical protein